MKLSKLIKNGGAIIEEGNVKLSNLIKILEVDIDVDGNLNCNNNELTSLNINNPIGGNLYCSYNNLTSLIINHPIGGDLYCRYNNLTSLTINHPIGGYLDCSYNNLTSTPKYNKLRNGDIGKNWIYADNMLFIFKSIRKLNKYTIYKSVFNNKNIKYLIADGTYYSHCATLTQGILDIEFKKNGGDVSRH
jgi:hypothetical protein